MSGRFRKSLALLLVFGLVFSVLGLGACAPAEPEEPTDTEEPVSEGPVEGGTFNFYISEPAYIDPLNLFESEGIQVGQAVFDSLVAFDPLTSEIRPAAAESWEANEDATVWTFNLVQGATFHNGREVTAADFKYAWERIANPENESEIPYHLAAILGYDEMQDGTATELEGVVAVDDYTLEVTLKYPWADFQYVVGHVALAPIPAEEVEAGEFSEMPIGNGPFKMSEPWARDQYIKVERFDDYYGDRPYIDAIEFKILADQDTAWLEFQAGTIDFTQIPTGQIQSSIDQWGESPDGYTANPGEQVLLGTELAVYYLLMNNEDEVLQDPVVRRALSLAVDRQAICTTVFEDTREPATGIVPDGIVGFQDDAWEYSRYDPDQARELLAEAGYPDGEGFPKITLEYNTGAGHEDILQLVQNDFRDIGIEAELEGMEWAQYLDMLTERTYQIGRLGWISSYPIMDYFLYPLFHSESADNYAFYVNPEVDEMLEEARITVDDDERIELYREIERMVGDDAPMMPLMFYRHTHIASDRVVDGVYSADGMFDFKSVWLRQ